VEPDVKRIVIPKEDAVFWLDRYGYWWNASGKFSHKKIIDHFHKSIRKDDGGFHLFQSHGNVEEKVYFPYEDTALFVFEVLGGDPVTLVLNNGRKVMLDPASLFTKEERLYVLIDGDPAGFTDRTLMKMADRIEEVNGAYAFVTGQTRMPISAV
jgi:hypothetical protein